MTIAVYELNTSREQSIDPKGGSTITLSYMALRDEDDSAIYTAVNTEAPATYGFLRKTSIKLSPLGGGVWRADVEYGVDTGDEIEPGDAASTAPAGDAPLGPEVSFDTSGGTQHITQSIVTSIAVAAGGGVAPNHKRAIGVSKSGVAGVDIVKGKLEFTITKTFGFISTDYLKTLQELTGTVNAASFYGFDAGEALFMGASGTIGSDRKARVAFKFAASPNETSVEISPDITLTAKGGWEYVWVTYGDAIDADSLVSVPTAAYVEQVYPDGDFTELAI